MKQLLLPVLFLFCTNFCTAQKTDIKLKKKLNVLLKNFHGKMGIYVYDLKSGKVTGINEDSIYPTASMVKIPILIGIMHKIYDSSLQFRQRMTYTDSLFYDEGDDMLASFKPGSTIELRRLISLMLSYSDNCASLWLQGLSGGGAVINNYMDQLGMKYTRVNSRTKGREEQRKIYGWGQTTPKELVSLMKMILDNKIINRQCSEKMLRMMGRQFWDEVAISQIPPGIFVADKNGAVDESRGEIIYVNAPHPYILAVCSKENEDKSWEDNNEAWVLTRKISATVFQHYNREIKYQPEAPIK